MVRGWIIIGALNGVLAVALGAYGAHNLDPTNPDLGALWAKATRYHMWHALALIGVGWAAAQSVAATWGRRLAHGAGTLMGLGLVLFCGGLYALALSGRTTPQMVIPFGGMAFILGWLALAACAMLSRPNTR